MADSLEPTAETVAEAVPQARPPLVLPEKAAKLVSAVMEGISSPSISIAAGWYPLITTAALAAPEASAALEMQTVTSEAPPLLEITHQQLAFLPLLALQISSRELFSVKLVFLA